MRRSIKAVVSDYISLTKPRVTGLVLFTAGAGMWLAVRSHHGTISFSKVIWMLLGTAFGVGAASALNCYIERDLDGLMRRTAKRPLPSRRISARGSLIFGVLLGILGVAFALLVNPLTGWLGAFSIISYVLLYTPMKTKTPKALAIGAVPGALPPLMGWTAVTGRLDAPAWVLFGILFLWQLPHFIAIALFRKDEYAGAGMKVLPAVRGDRNAIIQAVAFTAALLPISLLLPEWGVGGNIYRVAAALLGALFLGVGCIGLLQDVPTVRWARRFFGVSLIYLTVLLTVLVLNV